MGCTLAPTSMGIALNVLKQAKMLNTPTGQLIIAAAVLDDVIALLLLSELQALGNPTPVALMAPIAVSLGLMLFSAGWRSSSCPASSASSCRACPSSSSRTCYSAR